MEKTDHEVTKEGVLDVKNQSCLLEAEKSSVLSPLPLQKRGIAVGNSIGTDFSSWTPEKKNEQSHTKHEIHIAELPERYRKLSEFFDRMLCSLRLLGLRKRSPTFKNVSSQVEVLTGRKFSHRHLAQIKYIVPEAIQIDKLLVHDEKTMCMKPDVKITLHLDAVEDHKEHSMFMTLSNLFASRLVDFLHKHAQQDCDIPEAILPDPFNQSCLTSDADRLPMDLPSPLESELLSSSHLCPSFSSRFSRQAVSTEAKIDHLSVPSPACLPCVSECTLNEELDSKRRSPKSPKSSINLNNVEESQTLPGCSLFANERTPMKLLSESEVTLETPAQPTPKRSVPITEDKYKSMTGQNSLVSNLIVKRSLDFSTLGGEEMSSDLSSGSIEHHEDADNALIMERKSISKEDQVNADVYPHEERRCSFSKEEKNYQSHLTAARKESLGLSDLVRLIHRIFQSVGCRSMTKVELVHKIIVNDYDIDENTDVEGQIEHLERLVPEWLCKKSAPTGDLLYSIKKVPDLSSVCERVIGV
ncbi:CDT1-like protein a, chloroplastic isoform X3 [Nicotiana tabacum]|uniref:CDT1-like protein a, chloroplastic isoform X3 n=2 Tax=Nicotiana TaxID=4085 RepID=A0A1S3YGF5_TOBAC|nr:PREDICTED: CDT1-like protein a, chloroplastic isoform X3 [Nicotiana sylvestris]XP_016451294.1 PREDICTED: CDT1-like protein a, chloroplastic isoform X3 [Nicotiana tabacum]